MILKAPFNTHAFDNTYYYRQLTYYAGILVGDKFYHPPQFEKPDTGDERDKTIYKIEEKGIKPKI